MKIIVTDSDFEIRRKIGKAIASKIKERFDSAIKNSKSEINSLLKSAFLNSKTFKSLEYGKLRGELGLTRKEVTLLASNIDQLYRIDNLESSSKVPKITNNGISYKTGIQIVADPNLYLFSYFTEKGDYIPYMEWLLYSQGKSLVSDYRVSEVSGKGRSLLAIMIKDQSSSYKVDSRFVGSPEDNWITRIINENAKKIEEIVSKNAKER